MNARCLARHQPAERETADARLRLNEAASAVQSFRTLRVPDPEPERWQEQLKEVARTMHATILRNRDIVRISIGRVPRRFAGLELDPRHGLLCKARPQIITPCA